MRTSTRPHIPSIRNSHTLSPPRNFSSASLLLKPPSSSSSSKPSMPRAPFPELPFNSLYPLFRQTQILQKIPPLEPLSPSHFGFFLRSRREMENCPHQGTEDISINNCINLSKSFRTAPPFCEQWDEDVPRNHNETVIVEDIDSHIYPSLESPMQEEVEEVRKISEELLSSLIEVLDVDPSDEDREMSARSIAEKGGVYKTDCIFSKFFIRHLPLLLARHTRQCGMRDLQKSLSVFSNAVTAYATDKMMSAEKSQIGTVYGRCFNFRKALRWAVDDLKAKITRNYSELPIMRCVKTVFLLVLSFHYREQRCSVEVSDSSEQSKLLSGSVSEPRLVGINSDSIPVNPSYSVENLEATRIVFPSRHQDQTDNSNHSVHQYEEFMAQEEQVFLERRLPVPNDGALVTMFHSHIVPMTPVVARNNGRFVRGTQRTELSIMDAAYAYEAPNGDCVMPCEFVLNRTYTPDKSVNMTQGIRYLTYVGFVYPDNTMLSYIPIKNVRIIYENHSQKQHILRSGSTTFAFLHMDLPNSIYQNLKILAKDVYLHRKSDVLFVDHFEELQLDRRTVRIEVLVKSERTVRIEDQGKYLDYPVLQALFQCRHDLCGKSLMHLRFTSTKRGSQRMQLRLILFGITIERNPYNYHDPIFDLLNTPPGPIQTPLPIFDLGF